MDAEKSVPDTGRGTASGKKSTPQTTAESTGVPRLHRPDGGLDSEAETKVEIGPGNLSEFDKKSLEGTVYLGNEVDDALEMAEQTEI